MDSNHRRRKPADLQSAPFGHSGICPSFSWKLKVENQTINPLNISINFFFDKSSVFQLNHKSHLKLPIFNSQLLTFSSLLSDSNQRPRDYKSRALANWAKEAITQKMQPSRSNASETAANLVIYFFSAKHLRTFYLLRCFSLYFTSCFSSASMQTSTDSSNVLQILLA